MRFTELRIVTTYVLALVVIGLGSGGSAFLPDPSVLFPRVLCTAAQVLDGAFQVSLCTQKLFYKVGDVASITVGFKNLGSSLVWARDAEETKIVFGHTTMFSDTVFCGIPEGCSFSPNEIHSWTFHWPMQGQGTYQAIATLLDVETCNSPACKLVPNDPVTIGLTFNVVEK